MHSFWDGVCQLSPGAVLALAAGTTHGLGLIAWATAGDRAPGAGRIARVRSTRARGRATTAVDIAGDLEADQNDGDRRRAGRPVSIHRSPRLNPLPEQPGPPDVRRPITDGGQRPN